MGRALRPHLCGPPHSTLDTSLLPPVSGDVASAPGRARVCVWVAACGRCHTWVYTLTAGGNAISAITGGPPRGVQAPLPAASAASGLRGGRQAACTRFLWHQPRTLAKGALAPSGPRGRRRGSGSRLHRVGVHRCAWVQASAPPRDPQPEAAPASR